MLGAQRALQLADWSGRPQLTCIQSVVLFPVVLMHAGGIKRLASWIAAALRMAQLLDLHKLDDKNNARRSGASANFTPVEREIGKRLYFSLAHGEVNFASRWLGLGDAPASHRKPYVVKQRMCTDHVQRPWHSKSAKRGRYRPTGKSASIEEYRSRDRLFVSGHPSEGTQFRFYGLEALLTICADNNPRFYRSSDRE